jgi:acetyltransferase-like isoleucine patch superfamily enzyme
MPSADLSGIHIIGAGGLGRDFVACFKEEITIAGFWDDNLAAGKSIGSFSILGKISEFLELSEPVHVIIAFGNPLMRKQFADKILATHHQLTSVVHSTAKLFDATTIILNAGCIVFPGVQMTTDISIGMNSIIHSSCSLHHDTRIGSNCMIMPGNIFAGNVDIGNDVYVGPQHSFTFGTKVNSGERI